MPNRLLATAQPLLRVLVLCTLGWFTLILAGRYPEHRELIWAVSGGLMLLLVLDGLRRGGQDPGHAGQQGTTPPPAGPAAPPCPGSNSPGPSGEQHTRGQTVWVLIAVGVVGWLTVLVGSYLGRGHWLTGAGLLLTAVATFGLLAIVQQEPPGQ
jgi:hypothetical protein